MKLFNVQSQVMKIGAHKGETMYYAKPEKAHIIPLEVVVQDIAEASSLTTGDVLNAIDRLAYYLRRELAEGNTVQLGRLGTFRVSVSSKYVATPQEVNASILKNPKVVYVLNDEMKLATKKLRLSVINPYTIGTGIEPTTGTLPGSGTTEPGGETEPTDPGTGGTPEE